MIELDEVRFFNMAVAYGKFAAVYDRLMADVNYDAWAGYLLALLKDGGIQPGNAVLDCACGTGEITLRLQREGYVLTGADCSEQMLEIAQQKARKAGQRIPFICQDMRNLSLHKPMSAITCACDGVNYLLSDADAEQFFLGAYRSLKDGGLLLFDVSSAYKLEHILGGQTFGEDEPECTYLWQNCYDPKSRLLEMRIAFFQPDGQGKYTRFDERHVQRAHQADHIANALARAGFTIVGIYDAFTKDQPTAISERIQFVARKNAAEDKKNI